MSKIESIKPLLNEGTLKKAGLEHFHFLDAIAELPYVEAIYLFGSRARGDYWKNSDIDLAIKYSDDDEWHRKVVKVIVDEISDTFFHIDLVDYNDKNLNTEFRNMIEREKVAIYETLQN
jgi:predicted nucleotidyltransferase